MVGTKIAKFAFTFWVITSVLEVLWRCIYHPFRLQTLLDTFRGCRRAPHDLRTPGTSVSIVTRKWPFCSIFFKRVCHMGAHTFRRGARPKRAGGVHHVCQSKFELPTTLQSQDFAFWSQKNSSIFIPPPVIKRGGSFKKNSLSVRTSTDSSTFSYSKIRKIGLFSQFTN